ncbi:MAG: cytochrome c oxidase assembly protein, partial [Nakamurella sp.]
RKAAGAIGTPGRWPMTRLLGAEVLLLMVAVGTSAELSQLTPPAFAGQVTMSQTLLGYDLAGPPTALRLLVDWCFEVLFGTAAIGLAGWYLAAVLRLHRRGRRWPARRTVCWLAGCLVILLATSSGLGRYEPALFSVHMATHMLLAFLAPGLLSQGAPIMLVRDSSRAAANGLPTADDWLGGIVWSWPARLLTHPIVALILLVGSPFALYFTSAFDVAARFHWAHMALDGYFLVVGYLFAWPLIGTDPAPRPLPNLVRVGMVLAAAPFTAAFAAVVISTQAVIGNGAAGSNMYSALAEPWVPDLLADQRLAGILALAIGETSLFAALVVLLARWAMVDDDPDASGMIGIDALLDRSVKSAQPQAVRDDQQ